VPQETEGTVDILAFKGKSFGSCPVEGQENVYPIYASSVEGFSEIDCIDIAFGTAE
jgi:hypothetical protein